MKPRNALCVGGIAHAGHGRAGNGESGSRPGRLAGDRGIARPARRWTTRDVARIAEHYSQQWRADRLVLVGYSFGAAVIRGLAGLRNYYKLLIYKE